ncbi:MAG: hypothetical protein OXI12_09820 [Gammaproteobacteria bacterium]|nr:hypothetical protein [Gammaproteobacteria bacterium]
MGAVSSIVLGMALGALGWWLSVSRWRTEGWVGAIFIAAAVCLLANGAIAALGRSVALNVITAAGLWAFGLRLLLGVAGRHRAWALAIVAAGVVLGALAVIEWGR